MYFELTSDIFIVICTGVAFELLLANHNLVIFFQRIKVTSHLQRPKKSFFLFFDKI